MGWSRFRDNIREKLLRALPQGLADHYTHARNKRKYQRGLERNRSRVPDGHIPRIFHELGDPLDIFFLRDDHYRHNPYSLKARFFLWDRFNYGLPVHFYTGFHLFAPLPSAERRYGWLVESEAIAYAEYEEIYRHPEVHRDFDKVFTFSEKTLDRLPNACFVPAGYVRYGHPWYDSAALDPERFSKKSANVSIVSSDKDMCPLHTVRRELAEAFLVRPELGVDVYGTVGGGAYAAPDAYLSAYRFSIALENDIQKYFFTEKILNCFASMTIPLYVGASGITDFFNEDGILFLTPEDCKDPERIALGLTPQEYEGRKAAVLDNYNRVQDYLAIENFIYSRYLKDDAFFAARRRGESSVPVSRI